MNTGNAPKCKKISLSKLIVSPTGIMVPQCQSCIHKNCGNPIEKFKISIMGITKEWRLFNNNGTPLAVFECEHYSPNPDDIKARFDSLK